MVRSVFPEHEYHCAVGWYNIYGYNAKTVISIQAHPGSNPQMFQLRVTLYSANTFRSNDILFTYFHQYPSFYIHNWIAAAVLYWEQ